jgi:hypothetical protein
VQAKGGEILPNRIIKESICTSDTIDGLSDAEEAMFYRLLVNCDDYGRMDGRPQILLAKLYPLRLGKIKDTVLSQRLQALERVGLIDTYTVKGRPLIQIKTWQEHQRVRNQKSKYPGIEEADSICHQLTAGRGQLTSIDGPIQSNPIQSESNPIQSADSPSADSEIGTKAQHLRKVESFFEAWWKTYPRKEDKKKAREAFTRQFPYGLSKDDLNTRIENLEAHTNRYNKEAMGREARYVKLPATFLNAIDLQSPPE